MSFKSGVVFMDWLGAVFSYRFVCFIMLYQLYRKLWKQSNTGLRLAGKKTQPALLPRTAPVRSSSILYVRRAVRGVLSRRKPERHRRKKGPFVPHMKLNVCGRSEWFFQVDSVFIGRLRPHREGSTSFVNGPRLLWGAQDQVCCASGVRWALIGLAYS